ncbi:AraC family transcriptional regulator [Spirosoma arcticum]
MEMQEWEVKNRQPQTKLKLKSPHFHDEYQIGFVRQGFIENTYRKSKILVTPQKLYIIQPAEIHAEDLVREQTLRFCFAFITPQRLQQSVEEMTDGKQVNVDFNELLMTNNFLNNQFVKHTAWFFSTLQQPSSNLEQETRFLGWITTVLANRSSSKLRIRTLGNEQKAVKAVKVCLADNFAQPTSLAFLADVAGLSKFHLLRSFVKETGMTIHDYQTQLKICKAKELLKKGSQIVDVALELGFFDQAHFSKCFKRFTSQTPGQFR